MKAKKISWVHEYDEKRRINRIRFRIKQEKREKKQRVHFIICKQFPKSLKYKGNLKLGKKICY